MSVILPVRANLPKMQKTVAKFNRHATPRSYLLSTKNGNKWILGGGVTLWVTNALTPLNALLAVSILESFGIAKETAGLKKLPASKGSLIARAAGTALLGGGAALLLAITKLGVLATPLFGWTGLVAAGLGILTLAAEKVVRMVKVRSSAKQLKHLTQTRQDAEVLSQAIREEKMSSRNQLRLVKRLLRRTKNGQDAVILGSVIKGLEPGIQEKIQNHFARKLVKKGVVI